MVGYSIPHGNERVSLCTTFSMHSRMLGIKSSGNVEITPGFPRREEVQLNKMKDALMQKTGNRKGRALARFVSFLCLEVQ